MKKRIVVIAHILVTLVAGFVLYAKTGSEPSPTPDVLTIIEPSSFHWYVEVTEGELIFVDLEGEEHDLLELMKQLGDFFKIEARVAELEHRQQENSGASLAMSDLIKQLAEMAVEHEGRLDQIEEESQ